MELGPSANRVPPVLDLVMLALGGQSIQERDRAGVAPPNPDPSQRAHGGQVSDAFGVSDRSGHELRIVHCLVPSSLLNTFLSSKGSPTIIPQEVIRATTEEKEYQISMLQNLHAFYGSVAGDVLQRVKTAAIHNDNIFELLMDACKTCSLGQITHALFEVGGQYRRNM
jgi:hypothetical protein